MLGRVLGVLCTMPLQAPGPTSPVDSPTIPACEMEGRFIFADPVALLAQGPFDFIVVGAGAGGCALVARLFDEALVSAEMPCALRQFPRIP